MKPLQNPAILIRAIPVKEYDAIYVLLTPDYGKVRLYRKGAKRQKSRFSRGLESYNLLDISFGWSRRQSLGRFFSFHVAKGYHELVRDIHRSLVFSMVLEAVDKLSIEGDAQPKLFAFVQKLQRFMAQTRLPADCMCLYVLVKLCQFYGVTPLLAACQACGKRRAGYFSLKGGIVCGQCLATLQAPYFVCSDTVRGMLRHMAASAMEAIDCRQVSRAVMRQYACIMVDYLKYNFNITLRAWSVMASL